MARDLQQRKTAPFVCQGGTLHIYCQGTAILPLSPAAHPPWGRARARRWPWGALAGALLVSPITKAKPALVVSLNIHRKNGPRGGITAPNSWGSEWVSGWELLLQRQNVGGNNSNNDNSKISVMY